MPRKYGTLFDERGLPMILVRAGADLHLPEARRRHPNERRLEGSSGCDAAPPSPAPSGGLAVSTSPRDGADGSATDKERKARNGA
jgi:hypothetical protein